VFDHTVHLADLLRWYLGSEAVEVYARTNRIFHEGAVDVETGGLVMVTFENGVFATIDCSWSRPDYWPAWGGLGFEMVTERGAVVLDAFKQRITVYRPDLQRPVWNYWGSDINQAMIEEFAAAIREGRSPRVTGVDGLRATEIALAAYRSAESGQPARLERV
jgi:predicted dehydrogenase